MMRLMMLLLVLTTGFFVAGPSYGSDSEKMERLERKLNQLEFRVEQSEKKLFKLEEIAKSFGPILFLFGAFCALWAQNNQRNAWLWFFFGAFLHVFAVLVLLYKNEPKT